MFFEVNMPTLAVEQRRLFKIRPVAQWMRYRYPIAMTITGELPLAAAPLYELKGNDRNNCVQFISDWLDHLIVQHEPIIIPSGVTISGKGFHPVVHRVKK